MIIGHEVPKSHRRFEELNRPVAVFAHLKHDWFIAIVNGYCATDFQSVEPHRKTDFQSVEPHCTTDFQSVVTLTIQLPISDCFDPA